MQTPRPPRGISVLRHVWCRPLLCAVAVCGAVMFPTALGADRKTTPAATPILKTGGFFRCHFTWKTELARRSSGALQFARVARISRGGLKLEEEKNITCTPPPPADWASPDFDDRAWVRARGPLFTRVTRRLALLCVRGKFRVPEPAKAGGLTLSLSFRGGVVVYVNGRELVRSHLPKGKIGPDTPATDYSKDAYTDPDGYLLRWVGFGDPEKYGDRFRLRARHLNDVKIPSSMLRKGLNVLAVELHRAPTAEVMHTGRPRRHTRRYTVWSMLSLERLDLAAPPGSTVAPNFKRSPGLRVWTHPVTASLHGPDYGDPNDPPQPLQICGAPNGAFSAQFVVGSDRAIHGLKVVPDELSGPKGAVLPASAVNVRYATLGDHPEGGTERRYPYSGGTQQRYRRGVRRFDGLLDEPPDPVAADGKTDGAIQPVWVTVRAPRDARPGTYSGALTVHTKGAPPTRVPLEVYLADWPLPDPADFVTHVGLIQSPDTLAVRYKVPMWSERHWELIERSFKFIAQVGGKTLYIPLIRRTYFGNKHSMVRWIKKADGSYDHDFSIVEKYVGIAAKHLKRPPVVCAYCWEVSTGSIYMSGKHHFVKNAGMPFTIVDPKTGKLTEAVGPTWGSKGIRAFWRPVMDGLRRVLAKHGLAKSLMVGICGDRHARKDAVEDLRAVAPEAGWVVASHNMPTALHKQPVSYATGVWGLTPPPPPATKRYYGWKSPYRRAAFPRYGASVVGHSLRTWSPLGVYRSATEAAMTGARGRLQGIGRCGADFWHMRKIKYSSAPICGRYPETAGWHGGWLHNSFPYILAPGKDGAVATARFEMFREGIQETEARVVIEKVLTDPAKRARLGSTLAARCQAALDKRIEAYREAIAGGGTYVTWAGFADSGWQKRSWDLYAAAAAVTGGKPPKAADKAQFFGP